MPDESPKQTEDVPPVDPFEAELVAYLDGELDTAAARGVEARLATDPAARAKAAALKKTFDLLDFLPKPEPTSTFTTRTLDRIPAIQSGSRPVVLPTASQPGPVRATADRAAGTSTVSSSIPVAISQERTGWPVPHQRSVIWAAGIIAFVVALTASGYLGAVAFRPFFSSERPSRDPASNELPLSDHRLIEALPLYAGVDDFEFVKSLGESDLFAREVANAPDRPGVVVNPADSDRPTGPAFVTLARAFMALPPARQEAIREIDRQLHAEAPATRDRHFRVLEAYAVWLDRLPDAERKGVLGAATPGLRLGVVRDLREKQWIDGLPLAQRNQLLGLNPNQKSDLIQQWRSEERRQRSRWAFIRKNADAITGNRIPWPFDTPAGRKEVLEFARTAFRIDDPKRCRLTPAELADYRSALAAAEKNGAWAWYGKMVHELDGRYESLPEPASPKLMYQDFADLPQLYGRLVDRPGFRKKLAPHVGKWPDFPLELHDELRIGKFGPAPLPPLGPARLSDFKEPVRAFMEAELLPKMTQQERGSLRALENRWPDYSRKLLDLARNYDVRVPGVMLPGSPRLWEATYGVTVRPGRR